MTPIILVALVLASSCDGLKQPPFLNRRPSLRLQADYLSSLAGGASPPESEPPEVLQSDLAETIIMMMNQKVDAQQVTIEELRRDNNQLLAMMRELQESREISRSLSPPPQAPQQMTLASQQQQQMYPPQLYAPQAYEPPSFALGYPTSSQQNPLPGQTPSLSSYVTEPPLVTPASSPSAALEAAATYPPFFQSTYLSAFQPADCDTYQPPLPPTPMAYLAKPAEAPGPTAAAPIVDVASSSSRPLPSAGAQQRFAMDTNGNMALAQPSYPANRQPVLARFAMDADGNFLLAQPSYPANPAANRQPTQQQFATYTNGNMASAESAYSTQPDNPMPQPSEPIAGLAQPGVPPKVAQINYPRPLPSSGPVSGLAQPAFLDPGQPTAYPRPMANYPGVPLPPDDDARKRMANAHSILVEYANKQIENRRQKTATPDKMQDKD